MLSDLIRALLAAALVGVLPGYAWAHALCAGRDLLERLVWGIALSLALVPLAALVLAPLSGGVALPTAVAAVLLVGLAPLGARLVWRRRDAFPRAGVRPRPVGRFRPALPLHGAWTPVLPSLPPPGSLALAPVLVAAALMLYANKQLAPLPAILRDAPELPLRRLTQALGVLLALAAVLAARIPARDYESHGAGEEMSAGRGDPAGRPYTGDGVDGTRNDPGPGKSAVIPRWSVLGEVPLAGRGLLAAVCLGVLARAYAGPLRHDWPYVRGVDQFSHAVMAELVMRGEPIDRFLLYPPGFPALVALVSRLSGLAPLELFPVLGPALVLLPPLAAYVLARGLWGWRYGVCAAFAVGMLAQGPYLYFTDAMYPNLLASGFLLVLAMAALFETMRSPALSSCALLAICGSSVVLYHTVATLYLALLLGVVGALALPVLLLRDRRLAWPLLCSLAALGVLSVAYAWDTYDVPGILGGLLGQRAGSESLQAASMATGTQGAIGWDYLTYVTSMPVLWFGLLGALLLLLRARRLTPAGLLCVALLCCWCALLWAGSRTERSGFPHRFARDLGVPLSILAAFGLVAVLRGLRRWRRTALLGALPLLLLLGVLCWRNVRVAGEQSRHVLLSPEIEVAGRWLRERNTGGTILVSPHWNQVPGRMMLALGGYSGLQSFAGWQLDVARDLPPSGAGPLRDVLWVLGHPDDPRTRGILERYDVRYVVLYKQLPAPSLWRGRDPVDTEAFERETDRYAVGFENDAVLILRVR